MFLTRYGSDRLFNQLNHELFNMLDKPAARGAKTASTDKVAQWVPQVDIKEGKDKYAILVDVPGVELKDIEITLDKAVLTVAGERESEDKTAGKDFKFIERSRGRFERRFNLPDSVDESKISASGENGVLKIIIPKVEDVLPRKITIQ